MNLNHLNANQVRQSQYALWIGLGLLLGSSLLLGLSIRENFLNGATPLIRVYAMEFLLVLSSVVCILLSRTSKYYLGAIQLCSVIILNSIGNVIFIQDIGLVLGIATTFAIFFISITVLTGQLASQMIVVGIAGGLTTILLDAFYTGPRMDPGLTGVIPYLLAGSLGAAFWVIRSQFTNLNLRSKLVFAFVTITFASVLVVTIINNVVISGSLTLTTGEKAKTIVAAKANEVSGLLESQINLLTALSIDGLIIDELQSKNKAYSGTPEVIRSEIQRLNYEWITAEPVINFTNPLFIDRLNNPVAGHLLEYNLRFPQNVEILATDKYGALVAAYSFSSNANVQGHPSFYDYSNQAWWQAAYNQGLGNVYISDPEFSESIGTLTINIGVPIRKPGTGEVLGVMRSTLSLVQLVQITKIPIGETGFFDITFDITTPQHLHQGEYSPIEPIDLAILEKAVSKPYVMGSYAGDISLISLSHITSQIKAISQLGWDVVFYQREEEALRPITQQTKNNTAFAIIVALVVGGFASVIAQAISTPITKLTAVAKKVANGNLDALADESGQDEISVLSRTFNSMTAQLRNTITTLEQRVRERTRAIEISSEVSRRLSTILDQKQLVLAVVEEIQHSFEFYHAHIYLYDEEGKNLVMVGGTGEAGQKMMARGHKIARGRGLVGRAAETNSIVLVPDTGSDPDYLSNSLLPETISELAVPISIGEQVLGVLDVQQNIHDGLTEQTASLMQSIANQVAIAVQNAQLFTEAQQLAKQEERIYSISQKIQKATTIENVLETAANELGMTFGTKKVIVQLNNPITKKGKE